MDLVLPCTTNNEGNKALKAAFWLLNAHFTKPGGSLTKFVEVNLCSLGITSTYVLAKAGHLHRLNPCIFAAWSSSQL